MIGKCHVCGREYEKYREWGKYCSDACIRVRWKEKRQGTPQKRSAPAHTEHLRVDKGYEFLKDPGPVAYGRGAIFTRDAINEMCTIWGAINPGSELRRRSDGVAFVVVARPYHRARKMRHKYYLKPKSP